MAVELKAPLRRVVKIGGVPVVVEIDPGVGPIQPFIKLRVQGHHAPYFSFYIQAPKSEALPL